MKGTMLIRTLRQWSEPVYLRLREQVAADLTDVKYHVGAVLPNVIPEMFRRERPYRNGTTYTEGNCSIQIIHATTVISL